MESASENCEIEKAITKYVHHRNLSIFYLIQNIFCQGKKSRTINLNTKYMVLFNNPRDKLQILTLARQMYQGKTRFFLEAFEDATREPYGYLLVDLRANTPEDLRLRTGLFPPALPAMFKRKTLLKSEFYPVSDILRCVRCDVKMSERLWLNWALSKTLVKVTPAVRKSILRNASNDLITAIGEIALNILKGRIPLKEHQKGILKKWCKAIRTLNKISAHKEKEAATKAGRRVYRPSFSFCNSNNNKPARRKIMEHTEKMYLVPKQELDKLRPGTTDNIRDSVIRRLDGEISAILQRRDIPDDVKIKMYSSVLQRCLVHTRHSSKEVTALNLVSTPDPDQQQLSNTD
ncbi:uncharacterized protein LOC143808871 [Ranitomeya variabilis]|uniref:uncharacterized protein LOC143808871 n=1 Tax=Ranitomeya variabilis TaxID=490064 RepID=UPI0040569B41